MGLMMLLGLLLIAIVIGAAVYLAVPYALRDRSTGPRELLQQRLAAGEITTDEYLERESALRDSQPARRRR